MDGTFARRRMASVCVALALSSAMGLQAPLRLRASRGKSLRAWDYDMTSVERSLNVERDAAGGRRRTAVAEEAGRQLVAIGGDDFALRDARERERQRVGTPWRSARARSGA